MKVIKLLQRTEARTPSSRSTAASCSSPPAIDNLLKGAVGQAVQNMNLMFGIDETAGLRLKASAF